MCLNQQLGIVFLIVKSFIQAPHNVRQDDRAALVESGTQKSEQPKTWDINDTKITLDKLSPHANFSDDSEFYKIIIKINYTFFVCKRSIYCTPPQKKCRD